MYALISKSMTEYTVPQRAERSRIDTVVLSTTLASFIVLVYDHILTFGDEIKYIWRRRISVISVLFLLNRYFTFFSMSIYLSALTSTPMTPVDGTVPTSPVNVHTIIMLVIIPIVSVLIAEMMLILRVSAVFRNNKFIITLLVFLWIVHLIMMVVQVTTESSVYISSKHISQILYLGQSAGLIFVLPAVIFDTVVGALLTLGLYRGAGQFRDHMPLAKLIMRDGILYFLVIFASNITWILTQIFLQARMGPNSVLRESDLTPLEIWSACITTTMISRLTLNIRQYVHEPPDGEDILSTRMRFRMEMIQPSLESEWTIDNPSGLVGPEMSMQ